MERSGSIEIPRVIVGLGSVRDVPCALPFKANIAEGLALERLQLVVEGKHHTPRGVGMAFLAIDNKSLHQSRGVIPLYSINLRSKERGVVYCLVARRRRYGLYLQHLQAEIGI